MRRIIPSVPVIISNQCSSDCYGIFYVFCRNNPKRKNLKNDKSTIRMSRHSNAWKCKINDLRLLREFLNSFDPRLTLVFLTRRVYSVLQKCRAVFIFLYQCLRRLLCHSKVAYVIFGDYQGTNLVIHYTAFGADSRG